MNKDLKIKIPRFDKNCAHSARAKEYWDLVRKHGKSRKDMVDFICGIGGYSNQDITSAIEFNVKFHFHVDMSVETLWGIVTSPDFDGPTENLERAKAIFWRMYKRHENALWDWGLQAAYQNWEQSDTPYETFTGERVEWTWQFYGRSNGHLCMLECESHRLNMHASVLRADMQDTEDWSNVDVRKLFILCVQNTVDLQPKKIAKEIVYQAAWTLWRNVCEDALEAEVQHNAERSFLSDTATILYGMLTSRWHMQSDDYDMDHRQKLSNDLKAICKLADVPCE